jgi:Repeat of unknown function (DUF5648)
MKSSNNLRRVAAALLAACIATTSFTSTASAEEIAPPATGYIPFIPIIFPIFPIKPIKSSCELRTTDTFSNWFATRDIKIANYLGWSIDSAKIRYYASSTGTYTFRLVLRDTNRSGDMITKSEMKTVNLVAGEPLNVTTYFGNAYAGKAFDLSISHENVTGPGTLFLVSANSACAGTTTSAEDGGVDGAASDIGYELRGDTNHATNNVVEYFVPALNKFFVTAHLNDQNALDASPDFQRTGRSFKVPSKSTYGNVIDVYRFFSPEAVSHVYVDKTGHDIITSNPAFNLNDEGIDFGSVKPDAASTCPTWAPVKIYRSYNNAPVVNQRNHRYTNNSVDYAAMTGLGWLGEGAAFCAYSNTTAF